MTRNTARDKTLTVRMTTTAIDEIDEICDLAGMERTSLMRMAIEDLIAQVIDGTPPQSARIIKRVIKRRADRAARRAAGE